MLTIKVFSFNMLEENTYVVSDETHEGVVIDCGAYFQEEFLALDQYISQNQIQLKHVLCTHGHLDHCFGNQHLYATYHLQPELHADDTFLGKDLSEQAMDFFGMDYPYPTPPIGHYLTEGDSIHFGTHQFKVIHTPGHTPGGVCFYCEEEKVVFTGDTLFRMSVGRTDFKGSSWQQMMNSLHHIAEVLPNDVTVYSGHGPKTTIQDEKRYNPYMRE
jgi:glyoxylase-like metal-dependent hydrolase (beta-lactamase superfamily II)